MPARGRSDAISTGMIWLASPTFFNRSNPGTIMRKKKTLLALPLLGAFACAHAIDWSDTAIGYRYGTRFREPFNSNDIAKSIVNLEHASGYQYGTNFLNVDLLMSDSKDPSAPGSTNGAHEAYVVYRHTLNLGKVSGKDLGFGPVKGIGLTAGFDWNTKDDAGYNSKKRMLVAGPTLMMAVPAGFLNVSLLLLNESNAPTNEFSGTSTARYTYKLHPNLNLVWGIPLSERVECGGYANFIAAKGDNEFGTQTAAETHIDIRVMLDLSETVRAKKGTFRGGVGYEYWKNKFGNDANGSAGSGAFAKTPMVRAEYHF